MADGGGEIDLDVTVENLDNGLKVILLEDHSVPVISYQTFFRVGSRNEVPGITGISHFMEHMMFNGAKKYGPKEFDAILESNGGYSNAFTSNDMTAYYEDISSDGLELVIDLDTDRMKDLALDPKYLVSEMGVVMEERRLSIDNSIDGQMWEDLNALAFKAHPYCWPVLGWMSDLEKIDRGDCVGYFKKYYAPNNAVLIVAGDFKTKEALRLIHRYYDDIPRQVPPLPVRTVEPEQKGERRAKFHKAAELPEALIGYHGPGVGSDDIYALDVLQAVLSSGYSSRLYRKLVREMDAALRVYAYFGWAIDPDLFVFGVKMRPGRSTSEGEEAIYKVLEAIKNEGVSDMELEKAKNSLEADFVRSLQTVNGKARKIGRYEVLFGDYGEIMKVPGKYRAVTSGDLQRVVEKYFNEKNRTVITLIPESSEG
ncbi:MAG: insulinase family protein [Candidatus Krumholzibacteriota bacterium]|nr:insulinase family protein [Candidatus Krumholzibacteriota bacterium]